MCFTTCLYPPYKTSLWKFQRTLQVKEKWVLHIACLLVGEWVWFMGESFCEFRVSVLIHESISTKSTQNQSWTTQHLKLFATKICFQAIHTSFLLQNKPAVHYNCTQCFQPNFSLWIIWVWNPHGHTYRYFVVCLCLHPPFIVHFIFWCKGQLSISLRSCVPGRYRRPFSLLGALQKWMWMVWVGGEWGISNSTWMPSYLRWLTPQWQWR